MQISQREDGDRAVIEVSGELTIEHAGKLVETLKQALDSSTRRIGLDLAGVEAADIASLQIFCAVHKSALAKRMDVSITTISPPIRALALSAGFMEHEGCVPDDKMACLWLCQAKDKDK